jgi:hypothetical protein
MKKKIVTGIFVMLAFAAKAQFYAQGGLGMAERRIPGAELGVGYAQKKVTFSASYFALFNPRATTQEPLLVNVKSGYKITKAWHVYGGIVRQVRSSVDKGTNTSSWIAGIEYNTKEFKKGRFYYSANYIPSYFFVTVGMKFNY